ncbi:DNA-directed RNA polymerase subunit omega [Alistipes sp.]|uniref:DNA-directed RNA polymerase subunit omega n=1 Tax=Alistipes sp. TaxID=1872444 RepID=UPI0031FC3A15
MEIKKNIPNNTITRKLVDFDRETGNVYESINIIARRANQISTELKNELSRKLADFSSPTDATLEETFENREQIEISRYYERLPKPTIIATEEFLDGELYYRMGGKDGKEAKEAKESGKEEKPTTKEA